MARRIVAGVAVMFVAVVADALDDAPARAAQGAIMPMCLHDGGETSPHRARREAALTLARAINAAQGRAAEATRRYQPLAQLGGLPATPEGFVLRLHTDGEGYIFSVKDNRDPCHFGIFSDEKAFLFVASPAPPLAAS